MSSVVVLTSVLQFFCSSNLPVKPLIGPLYARHRSSHRVPDLNLADSGNVPSGVSNNFLSGENRKII